MPSGGDDLQGKGRLILGRDGQHDGIKVGVPD
jgi:hypothetical protein